MSFLTDVNLAGARSAQPAAAAANNGKFYMVTDEDNILERSNGSSWVQVSQGSSGGGGAWALAGTGNTATGVWDQSVDGTTSAAQFVGLSAFGEIMLLLAAVTASSSGFRQVQVSDNNGSSFRTSSGDYIHMNDDGAAANKTAMTVHNTSGTTARSAIITLQAFNITAPHVGLCNAEDTFAKNWYIPGTTALDAVQVINSAGNLNGGVIYCYGR